MQTPEDLLTTLHQRGVKLWLENGQFRFAAPKGVLLSEDVDALRIRKRELMALLGRELRITDIPIRPRSAEIPVPLTAFQQELWSYTSEPGRLSVRLCVVPMRIDGPLDTDLLNRCLRVLIQRHEVLRTRIVLVDGLPRQQVDTASDCSFETADLSGASQECAEQEALRLGELFLRETFSLYVGPLFAARLFRLADRDWVFILAMDQMISDAVSDDIIHQEVWSLYRQGLSGLPFSLPTLSLQFADYAMWQEQTRNAWLKEHEGYWRQRLADAPRTRLPIADGALKPDRSAGAILKASFGSALSNRLRSFARQERTLLPLVVLSIYLVTISRWCDQRDLVIAFVSNGRHRPELHSMVGFIASLLYLRIEMRESVSFSDLLSQVSMEFRSAHSHYDFDRARQLLPGCATELVFNWRPEYSERQLIIAGNETTKVLRVQPFSLEVAWPNKFIPCFYDTPAGINLTVRYRTDLLAPSRAEQLGDELRRLADELSRRSLECIASIR